MWDLTCGCFSNENCAWKITADPGYVVHVHVSWIDLEESSDCGFDYISLYDGREFKMCLDWEGKLDIDNLFVVPSQP